MTRRPVIIIAVVYLLCGFVANVLVAWGLAWFINPFVHGVPVSISTGSHPEAAHWVVRREQFAGYMEVTTNWLDRGFNPSFTVRNTGDPGDLLPHWLQPFRPTDLESGRHARRALAWGWPCVSVWCKESGDVVGEAPPRISVVGPRIDAGSVRREATFTPAGVQVPRVLPVRPIFPNTIYNTLFYAAILLGVHQGLIAAKRTSRKRRGLCPQCKYNLRGDLAAGCSECGWGG